MDRRAFLQLGSIAAGGALLLKPSAVHAHEQLAVATTPPARRIDPQVVAPGGQLGVITPNGSTLPLRRVGQVKVGHLIAQPIEHEFAPGLKADCWGYNGSTPGPTIEVVEGDRVRFYVT